MAIKIKDSLGHGKSHPLTLKTIKWMRDKMIKEGKTIPKARRTK